MNKQKPKLEPKPEPDRTRDPLIKSSVFDDDNNNNDYNKATGTFPRSSSKENLSNLDYDTALLLRMGYKQELLRGFTAFMNFSFAFTAVSVVPGLTIGFGSALLTGGPAVMVWSWVIGTVATFIVGLSMAEICSTYPSAGSVYHWAGIMSPNKSSVYLAYIDGWFNLLGNAAGDASYGYGFATVVASMVDLYDLNHSNNQINQLNSQQQTFQNIISTINKNQNSLSINIQVLIAVLTIGFWAAKNIAKVSAQGWISNLSAIFQLASTPIIVLVLFLATPNSSRAPASWVFGSFYDGDGFPSNHEPPYSCVSGNFNDLIYLSFIGLLNALFAFSGYEGGAHMSEETVGASTSAPKALLLTIVATAVSGFLFILALLFSMYTPSLGYYISDSSPFTNPVVGVLYVTCGYEWGMFLAGLLAFNLLTAGCSSVTVTTRIGYAMARDYALPFGDFLSFVDPKSRCPIRMCIFIGILDALLTLFPLFTQNTPNPTLAFTAVTAITVIGCQISYAIPLAMRASFLRNSFVKGDFHLGAWGPACSTIGSIWLILTSFIFFAPNAWPVDAYNMNYTCVVVVAVLILAGVNWFISGRYYFSGPSKEHFDEFEEQLNEAKAHRMSIDGV